MSQLLESEETESFYSLLSNCSLISCWNWTVLVLLKRLCNDLFYELSSFLSTMESPWSIPVMFSSYLSVICYGIKELFSRL